MTNNTLAIISSVPTQLGWPSLNTIRAFQGNFGGIVIPELKYGFASKVLFTPGYVVEDYQTRKLIRLRYLQAGFKHFPLNLYNTVPIYPGVYPDWNDNLINNYLDELLGDGLIPGGSCFSDGSKTIKNVVDPDLVPWVITGWENGTAINKPAMDPDNLFYVARQYFPNTLIYWHNPVGQDLPYVNPPDWGATQNPDGSWSDVNPQVWNYMVQSGCQGINFQGRMWESISNSVSNLNDYVSRVINGGDGWVKGDLNDFEECVAFNTEMGAPSGVMTGEAVRLQVSQLTGYCNG